MKRIRAFAMALVMVLSLAACGGKGESAPLEENPASTEDGTASTGEETTPAEGKSSESEEGEESGEEESTPASKTETLPEGPPTYTFDAATGTLTCSGGGEVTKDWGEAVKNALFETEDWRAKAEVKKIVMERGITSIGDGQVFGEWSRLGENLTEVVLPDTLTSIGTGAFYESALTSIVIPESVTEISKDAFSKCKKLTSVKLPSGLTEIPVSLFAQCISLTNIEIPKGVTRIEGSAFYGAGLTELTIPEGVTYIGRDFIQDTPITSLTLPASLTEWGSNLAVDSLTEVTFLCEATMDNVESLVGNFLFIGYSHPITIHAPAGSVIEVYLNRLIQNGLKNVTFVPV